MIARARAEMSPRVLEKLVSIISKTNINCKIFGIRHQELTFCGYGNMAKWAIMKKGRRKTRRL